MRDGVACNTGALFVRLLRTTLYGTHALRPQVLLQLDHLHGRKEVRRTGALHLALCMMGTVLSLSSAIRVAPLCLCCS